MKYLKYIKTYESKYKTGGLRLNKSGNYISGDYVLIPKFNYPYNYLYLRLYDISSM